MTIPDSWHANDTCSAVSFGMFSYVGNLLAFLHPQGYYNRQGWGDDGLQGIFERL
jgi:hypothetical protein